MARIAPNKSLEHAKELSNFNTLRYRYERQIFKSYPQNPWSPGVTMFSRFIFTTSNRYNGAVKRRYANLIHSRLFRPIRANASSVYSLIYDVHIYIYIRSE